MVTLQGRFRGLMAGIAVGDALGRPVEGSRAVPDWYVDDMLARSVSVDRVESVKGNVGVAALAEIREVLGLILDVN